MSHKKKKKRTTVDLKEVCHGIFMITERSPLPRIRPTVNIFVIAGGDGLVFDAGYGNRKTVSLFVRQFRRIEEICRERGDPFSVRRILVSHSHPDHFAGLWRLRRELGLSVLLTRKTADVVRTLRTYRESFDAHRLEYELLGRPPMKRMVRSLTGRAYELLYGTHGMPDPDEIVPEQGTININGETWSLIPSPGHSDDHISLYDPARGVLLAGDNVLGKIITWLGPPRSDPALYVRTLEAFLRLPKLDIILGSHGSPVHQPEHRIRSIISWRKKRREDVLAVVRQAGPSGVTARGILEKLYHRGGAVQMMMAEGWVMLTLVNLMEEGAVLRIEDRGKVFFRALPVPDCGDLQKG